MADAWGGSWGASSGPAPPSGSFIQDTIWNSIVSNVNALVLKLGPITLTSAKKKLPAQEETLDVLPQVVVCPSERAVTVKPLCFSATSASSPAGGSVLATYSVDVIFIVAGNRDYVTNMDVYAGWLENVRQKHQAKGNVSTTVPVRNVRCVPLKFIDRGEVLNNYDYLGLTVEVDTVEPALQ